MYQGVFLRSKGFLRPESTLGIFFEPFASKRSSDGANPPVPKRPNRSRKDRSDQRQ